MAIIYSYPQKTTPAGGDFLVITDSEQPVPNKNRTKSLTINNLANYIVTSTGAITGSGTLNTVAMFTPNGQAIGDSIITQNALGQGVIISGTLNITGNTTFLSTITAGGGTGTAGQVLSSTGTGIEWVDVSGGSGTVTGTGTTNTLPVWTDGPNGVLGNSSASQVLDGGGNVSSFVVSVGGSTYDFGPQQFSSNTFNFKSNGLDGGFYQNNFRFEKKLAVGRTSDPAQATLDVGNSTDTVPAAYFRNGVVLSNNPGGVQIDNTSMVIGGGNNDIVSGSDSCLAVGNNNQILNDSDNSLVVGQGNIIRNDADNCFAIGQSNIIDGTNTGSNSVRSQVLGFLNNLTNSYSSFIAGGNNTVTTGNNGFALGYSNTLQGQDSQFAFGEFCTGPANGQNTFMMGSALTGSDKSMAVGFRNDTSSYPAIDNPNGLGKTKFVVGVGSTAKSNAIIITEGGVNRGNPNVEQIPRIILPQQETLEFTSDANATANGIPTGGLYRNGNDLKINFNETAAGGNEGLAYLTPQLLTASDLGTGAVDPSYNLVLLSWTGGNGVYTLNLPLASANTNRLIRITTDGTLSSGAGDKIDITATGGETIDGNPSFQISKRYEGLAIFSTGSEWLIVQAKSH